MDVFLYLSLSYILLFSAGTFLGIPALSVRTQRWSGLWNISIVYSAGWLFALSLYTTGRHTGILLHLLLAGFWLAFQIRFHWIPYFIGAPEGYREEYEKFYKGTLSILPKITSRGVVPNFYTTLILVFLISIIIFSVRLLTRSIG